MNRQIPAWISAYLALVEVANPATPATETAIVHLVSDALELLEVVQTIRGARGPYLAVPRARYLHTFSPVIVGAHQLVLADINRVQGQPVGVGSMTPLLMSVMGVPQPKTKKGKWVQACQRPCKRDFLSAESTH